MACNKTKKRQTKKKNREKNSIRYEPYEHHCQWSPMEEECNDQKSKKTIKYVCNVEYQVWHITEHAFLIQ